MDGQIRRLRMERGWSQGEAAALAGMHIRRYRNYEYGNTGVPMDAAVALADAFGVSLDELAGREWPSSDMAMLAVTAEEAGLVACCRRMDADDRPGFLSTARALAYAGDAKKRGPVEAGRMAGRVLT